VTDDTDEAVWRSVVRGDDDAFATIWDRHYSRVLRHVSHLSHDHPDAEDVAAMALLEAWRKRRKVRFVEASLLPWLLVTASNLHKNAARARLRYANVLDRVPPPDSPREPGEQFEYEQLDPTLREALSTLNAQDLALLVLVALEGLPVKAAASVVGLRESAARTRLSRVRTRLRATVDLRNTAEGAMS
jgi:RNA polymerase sigma-70 factor (ECF subfamily)